MNTEQITIRTKDGECLAYVLTPSGEGSWPAVIFYMDAGGIRPAAIDMAKRLAGAGYVVLLSIAMVPTRPSFPRNYSRATTWRFSAR